MTAGWRITPASPFASEVDLEAQFSSSEETLNIVADEEAAHGEASVCLAPDDGLHVDDGQVAQKMVGRVVEHVAHGIDGAAHDSLHAVDGAQVVAAVDAFAATGADEDVLCEVGHADDFMGHDLADGENEIESAAGDELVDLCGPCVGQLAFRLF